jgi:phosphoglycerate kinase
MSAFSQFNFSGHKALIRVDFNVPLNADFVITDDNRMRAAVPTIQKILKDGGSVILMSHLGRPKDGPSDKYSLKHLLPHLQQMFEQHTVLFANDCIGEEAIEKSKSLQAGEILLLENLRFYKEEEKGDDAFAEKLASLGTVYVNDAFGTAHRAHASTAVIASHFSPEHRMFGLLMEAEVKCAEKVMLDAERPFTAILGGAKVSDKILIIEALLEKANNIIIGGGMAYTFLKAQGHQIGSSLCEDDRLELANQLLTKAQEKGVRLMIPVDSIIADRFAADAQTQHAGNDQIPDGWMGLDIGKQSIEEFSQVILESKTILWNGPMGVFEMEKFQEGTKAIALAIVEATKKGAFSLIGGGDSVAAINQFELADQVSYVSTGGGAMLEFFEGKSLPGIQAIRH